MPMSFCVSRSRASAQTQQQPPKLWLSRCALVAGVPVRWLLVCLCLCMRACMHACAHISLSLARLCSVLAFHTSLTRTRVLSNSSTSFSAAASRHHQPLPRRCSPLPLVPMRTTPLPIHRHQTPVPARVAARRPASRQAWACGRRCSPFFAARRMLTRPRSSARRAPRRRRCRRRRQRSRLRSGERGHPHIHSILRLCSISSSSMCSSSNSSSGPPRRRRRARRSLARAVARQPALSPHHPPRCSCSVLVCWWGARVTLPV
jgi:hypothetical protein